MTTKRGRVLKEKVHTADDGQPVRKASRYEGGNGSKCPEAPPAQSKGKLSSHSGKGKNRIPLTPTALFGSIVECDVMKPDIVVTLLLQVKKNTEAEPENEMAINTRHVINRTIPLLQIGDARGKLQAVILLALLINGAHHCNMMRRLKEAVSPTRSEAVSPPTCDKADSAVAARFQKFLDTFALPDTDTRGFIEQASEQNIYNVTGLEKLISMERVNVITYLAQEQQLFKSKFFQGRKIWRLVVDKSFERHIEVELMVQDETVESVRRIMSDRAAVLYGESGSGKTSTAILSCEEGNNLCIFMTTRLFANNEGKEMEDLKAKLRAEQIIFAEAVAKVLAEQMTKAEATKQNAGKKAKRNRTKEDPTAEEEAPKPVIVELPGTLCEMLTKYICKAIPSYQSLVKFDGNVVLVVDEVGSHPLLVRALCREHSSIVSLVKKMLNVTGSVGLVVCGTGCESGENSPLSSYPSTFEALRCEAKPFQEHVVKLMAKKGFVALAELLSDKKPTRASYYYNMSIDSKPVVYVQRLMLNRRFCAALLSELDRSFLPEECSEVEEITFRDDHIPWLTVLPMCASSALLRFKSINGLQKLSWDATSALFARALAYCYCGPEQAIAGAYEVQRVFGMVTDNARECVTDKVDVFISTYASGK